MASGQLVNFELRLQSSHCLKTDRKLCKLEQLQLQLLTHWTIVSKSLKVIEQLWKLTLLTKVILYHSKVCQKESKGLYEF